MQPVRGEASRPEGARRAALVPLFGNESSSSLPTQTLLTGRDVSAQITYVVPPPRFCVFYVGGGKGVWD